MKQVKNLLTIAILSLTFSMQAFAGDSIITNIEEPIQLKWLGNIENQPVFSLYFSERNSNSNYKVIITDEAGFVFFNSTVNSGNKAKQFLLNADELGNTTVHFEITSKETGKKTEYKVNLQQKTTQELKLVKL